ncbi:hypothetical protein QQ045_008655 [Rhodiola kirilowii]
MATMEEERERRMDFVPERSAIEVDEIKFRSNQYDSVRLLHDECWIAYMSATLVAANLNNIIMLNGTNFKDWKENITILLGCMDLDMALRELKPDVITGTSSESVNPVRSIKERGRVRTG